MKLEFENLSIGNLKTGEALSWDQLRRIVLENTRIATGRPIKNRTLEELAKEIQDFIDQRVKVQTEKDRENHNREVQIRAYEFAIDMANQEAAKWKKLYVEATRNIQKQ